VTLWREGACRRPWMGSPRRGWSRQEHALLKPVVVFWALSQPSRCSPLGRPGVPAAEGVPKAGSMPADAGSKRGAGAMAALALGGTAVGGGLRAAAPARAVLPVPAPQNRGKTRPAARAWPPARVLQRGLAGGAQSCCCCCVAPGVRLCLILLCWAAFCCAFPTAR